MVAVCAWCRQQLPATPGIRFCGQKCRQSAWRLRRLSSRAALSDAPMRFAYADPPYPGTARKYYGGEASFAGEVDHVALVASLVDAGYDGWALSTSAKALRDVLPLCPDGARRARGQLGARAVAALGQVRRHQAAPPTTAHHTRDHHRWPCRWKQ